LIGHCLLHVSHHSRITFCGVVLIFMMLGVRVMMGDDVSAVGRVFHRYVTDFLSGFLRTLHFSCCMFPSH
jgi:hypothetical protein